MIREATSDDLAAGFRVVREAFPAFVTTEAGFRHRQLSMPPEARVRAWAAEVDGEVVGWGRAFFRYEESGGSAHASVAVLPAHRGRGLGSALLEPALAHVAEAPRVFTLAAEDGEAFAESRGFERTQTLRVSAVDPREVDTSGLSTSAVEVRPLAEVGPEQAFAVDAVAALDVPADEPPDRLEYEQWVRSHWQNPDFDWTLSFAAIVDGRAVAVSYAAVDRGSGSAANAFTATLPEYRGRGLARLVKLGVLRAVAEAGVTRVLTDNDERNAPMLAVNERLGYRPYAAHGIYVLDRSGNGLRASAGST